MGRINGLNLFLTSVFLFATILVKAQTSTTTTTEPTPPPLIQPTTSQVSEATTNSTSAIPEAEITSRESTPSSTTKIIETTTGKTGATSGLANEPAKIIGIAIGIALLCLLIILGGIALQKHIRRQRIKKEETTPPKDFQNPVQMPTATTEATV